MVGKTALVDKAELGFAYAGYLIRLRPEQQIINSNYLHLCLSSHDLRLQIEVPARSTSGVHNINSKEVQKLIIPVAPLEEQKEVFLLVNFLLVAEPPPTLQAEPGSALP